MIIDLMKTLVQTLHNQVVEKVAINIIFVPFSYIPRVLVYIIVQTNFLHNKLLHDDNFALIPLINTLTSICMDLILLSLSFLCIVQFSGCLV